MTREKALDSAAIQSVLDQLGAELSSCQESAARLASELQEREVLFNGLMTNLDRAFWLADPEGRTLVYANPSAIGIWGPEVVGKGQDPAGRLDWLHEDERTRVIEAWRSDPGSFDQEFRIVHPSGRVQWLRERCFHIVRGDDAPLFLAGLAEDLTVEHAASEALERTLAQLEIQATQDPLTGVLNRRGLELGLRIELGRARRQGEPLLALILDLDDFKTINESHGHAAGDVVLARVGAVLRRSLRPTDLVGRIGGDEFLALLPATRIAEGGGLAERLRHEVAAQQLNWTDERIGTTVSIGLVEVAAATRSLDEVLRSLQDTLSSSKRSGKDRVSSGQAAPAPSVTGTDAVAVSDGESMVMSRLGVAEQQIVSLETGQVIALEFMISGGDGSWIRPQDRDAKSLDHDLLVHMEIDLLRRALLRSTSLPRTLDLHVNLHPESLVTLEHSRVPDMLHASRRQQRLCVEISEQQLVGDPGYLLPALAKLRAEGVILALDDVGFGARSLEALVVLEPQVIKVTRRLVGDFGQRRDDRRFLRRLVRLARSLEARVIAEGVEREEETEFLLESGVRFAQGPLWGSPQPLLEPSRS
ncbi:MAG: diguanylate cyclase [Planctomycetes bacterium]|nr:diguanylate cyclase [Planctomycetota bacterium]